MITAANPLVRQTADRELQFIACEWLLVGYCGSQDEQRMAIDLCGRYEGRVIYREGDILLIEVGGHQDDFDELLAKLPEKGVTHLWRSDKTWRTAWPRETNLCHV